jgi:hypothetical protein
MQLVVEDDITGLQLLTPSDTQFTNPSVNTIRMVRSSLDGRVFSFTHAHSYPLSERHTAHRVSDCAHIRPIQCNRLSAVADGRVDVQYNQRY